MVRFHDRIRNTYISVTIFNNVGVSYSFMISNYEVKFIKISSILFLLFRYPPSKLSGTGFYAFFSYHLIFKMLLYWRTVFSTDFWFVLQKVSYSLLLGMKLSLQFFIIFLYYYFPLQFKLLEEVGSRTVQICEQPRRKATVY